MSGHTVNSELKKLIASKEEFMKTLITTLSDSVETYAELKNAIGDPIVVESVDGFDNLYSFSFLSVDFIWEVTYDVHNYKAVFKTYEKRLDLDNFGNYKLIEFPDFKFHVDRFGHQSFMYKGETHIYGIIVYYFTALVDYIRMSTKDGENILG